MLLYDKTSDIYWNTLGLLTKEQMEEMPQFTLLFNEPCVLFDDGSGKVYDWLVLSSLAAKYGVELTGDDETDYNTVVEEMNKPRYSDLDLYKMEVNSQFNALLGIEEVSEPEITD